MYEREMFEIRKVGLWSGGKVSGGVGSERADKIEKGGTWPLITKRIWNQ